MNTRNERPIVPEGFDGSRATHRREHPDDWRFSDVERQAVWRAIEERRDIRKFRPDSIPDELLSRLLGAAHAAPSVGLSQPWRFIVVRDEATRSVMQAAAQRERMNQSRYFSGRSTQFLDLKIEGIREAPVSICVCCDRGDPDVEVLGRHTVRDADIYSTCLAIENFWLAARAEGVGVGWVSFYEPAELSELLSLPANVVPIAWLCVGYPDERPSRPGLESNGWDRRSAVGQVIFSERWGHVERDDSEAPVGVKMALQSNVAPWCAQLLERVRPGEVAAGITVRDVEDELVKPLGSLGVLEGVVQQWAVATGAPPPRDMKPAILVFAGDHGVSTHQVSLFESRVSSQIAVAAARGATAIGVLARSHDAALSVVDVGLSGERAPGVIDRRVACATSDISRGAAMTHDELRRAVQTGYVEARAMVRDCDVLIVGEIGIGNTTVAAALLAALTRSSARDVCGRGTGLDAQGLDRKRAIVEEALRINTPDAGDALECLRRVGGFEFAALVGAMFAAGEARRPILLDGFATGVAALAACRLQPALRDYLIAGHRSAELAHARVLDELGLEPLLDLRLRLGEASGAALAFPLVKLAATLHAEMESFDDARVDKART
ncbi:MAG: nicotinate-nucleotide--dimethylbenzimidazole phosphoribosyltransferase [Acidobacteria bacterium]|nr:nicotinate-nucleotide--dimethylbenzimidazole phosphoribosyltransferase [Acidobacteriota bacterium]